MRRLLGLAGRAARWRFTNIGPSLAWVKVSSPTPFELVWAARPLPDGRCATHTLFFLPRWSALVRAAADDGRDHVGRSPRAAWPGVQPGFVAVGCRVRAYARLVEEIPEWYTAGALGFARPGVIRQGWYLLCSGRKLAEKVRVRHLEVAAGSCSTATSRAARTSSTTAVRILAAIWRSRTSPTQGLRCEFHGWCWGADGACVDAPGNATVPPDGFGTMRGRGSVGDFSGRGSAVNPRSSCRTFPHLTKRFVVPSPQRVRAHPDAIFSNGFDLAHFGPAHGIDARDRGARRRALDD